MNRPLRESLNILKIYSFILMKWAKWVKFWLLSTQFQEIHLCGHNVWLWNGLYGPSRERARWIVSKNLLSHIFIFVQSLHTEWSSYEKRLYTFKIFEPLRIFHLVFYIYITKQNIWCILRENWTANLLIKKWARSSVRKRRNFENTESATFFWATRYIDI